MVANFMCNYVRLREFPGRAKAVFEFLKEAEIEVNLLIFWTVEGTDCCLGLSASRWIFVPIKHELGVAIGHAGRLRQGFVPSCLNIVQHKLDELVFGFLLSVLLGVLPAIFVFR